MSFIIKNSKLQQTLSTTPSLHGNIYCFGGWNNCNCNAIYSHFLLSCHLILLRQSILPCQLEFFIGSVILILIFFLFVIILIELQVTAKKLRSMNFQDSMEYFFFSLEAQIDGKLAHLTYFDLFILSSLFLASHSSSSDPSSSSFSSCGFFIRTSPGSMLEIIYWMRITLERRINFANTRKLW